MADELKEIRSLMPELNGSYDNFKSISDLYNYIRKILVEDFDTQSKIVEALYRQHYPGYFKTKPKILKDENLDLVIARSLGFDNTEHYLSNAFEYLDPAFENAVHSILQGDLDTFKSLITSSPALLYHNSKLGHRARLVDYLSSNGVEYWRQIVPDNADLILDEICKFGFDTFVTNNIYGGSTLRGLIVSSAHPKAAGIEKRLLEVLSKYKL